MDFDSFRTGPGLNIDDPNMEILAGIMNKGFFTKVGSAMHKM